MKAKFNLKECHLDFLSRQKEYGFKDKSTVIRAALDRLKRELEMEKLTESADLYAELYASDAALKELTESAITGWPDESG